MRRTKIPSFEKEVTAFAEELESKGGAALRDGFGKGLVVLGEKNKDVFALSADLTESNRMNWFQESFPKRFVEVGVAEQNLIGVAAGLARIGKVPFTGSFAVFSPGRSWDQIRVSVCYSNLPVKVYGGHAGITVGEDGATHEALEDITITRVLPNMTVIVPCDAVEMMRATIAAAYINGPVYLRGGRPQLPIVSSVNKPFKVGKAITLKSGKDVTIIACGMMVGKSLEAAHALEKKGVSVEVINMHTIKPLDKKTLLRSAKKTGCIVTAEEHQIIGGLGSAVCEAVSESCPVPVIRVGINDSFGESGDWQSLVKKYNLESKDVVRAVKKVLKLKKKREQQN